MATAADRRAFVAEHVNADLAYILDDAAVNETHQFALAAGLGSPCSDAADCRSAQLLVCSAAFNACGKAAMQQTAVLPNVMYCSAAMHLYVCRLLGFHVLRGGLRVRLHAATSSKPTRWMSDLLAAASEPFQGWPCLDSNGGYRGPLPRSCHHGGHPDKLIGKDASNNFKTAAAATYSQELCAWLADLILRSFFCEERLTEGATSLRSRRPCKTAQAQSGAAVSSVDEEQKATTAKAGRQHAGPPAATWWDEHFRD